jgi:hypothetical protein
LCARGWCCSWCSPRLVCMCCRPIKGCEGWAPQEHGCQLSLQAAQGGFFWAAGGEGHSSLACVAGKTAHWAPLYQQCWWVPCCSRCGCLPGQPQAAVVCRHACGYVMGFACAGFLQCFVRFVHVLLGGRLPKAAGERAPPQQC